MKIKKGLEKEWKEVELKNKKDFYGAGILDFTKKWVDLIEKHKGKLTANDISKYCDKADDGITGAMFSVAKAIIKKYVENGKEWMDIYEGKKEKEYQEFIKQYTR